MRLANRDSPRERLEQLGRVHDHVRSHAIVAARLLVPVVRDAPEVRHLRCRPRGRHGDETHVVPEPERLAEPSRRAPANRDERVRPGLRERLRGLLDDRTGDVNPCPIEHPCHAVAEVEPIEEAALRRGEDEHPFRAELVERRRDRAQVVEDARSHRDPIARRGYVAPMLLPTTLVGSYPQPEWLIDRSRLASRLPPRIRAKELWRVAPELLEQAQDDATLLAIRDQERAGLDILTDGEQRRESYSNRFATALDGIDLDRPGIAIDRSGHPNPAPRVVGPIRRRHPVEVRDLEFLKANTDRP
jgi:hypothetical protein